LLTHYGTRISKPSKYFVDYRVV